MAVAPTPTPRERVLTTILALCRVKTVGQLSPHDRRLVRDALAVVDQLSAAASAAPSPAPSHSDGSDTASDTASSASERSSSAHGSQSRLRQPTPARQFAARRHVPGSRKPARAAKATTAGTKTTAPRKPSKLRAPKWFPREDPRAVAQQEPPAPATGASKLRQPAIVVRPRAPSAPQSQSSFPLDPSSAFDASLIDCVSAQDFAEAAIDTAVEQLGQLLEWYAQVSGSALSVEVAPGDAQEPLRVTGEEAQQALLDVELSIKGVLEMSQELALAITRVWIGSPWLRARQHNIARDAAQVLAWIQRLTMVLDGCLEATFSDASGDEATPPVWRASLQPQPCSSVCKTIAEKRIKSPTKLSIIRAEYAVGAFIAELIGACAPSASENLLAKATSEDDAVKTQYKLMEAICAADKALDVVQTRCLQASEECCGAQDLVVWQEALDDAHAFATHALRVGLVGCSQQICSLDDCDLASMEIRAAEDEFPAEDRLSIDDYYNLKLYIATAHAAIGRANKKPADAKFACDVQEVLTSIVDELAVWADPRFDFETDARPYEQAANRDLIVWCLQVLKEISK